jgi:hypothetical protein
MTDHPILYQPDMIRAKLDGLTDGGLGRKWQTLRLVKPQPDWIENSGRWHWPIPKSKIHPGGCTAVVSASREWWEYLLPDQMLYQPGDLLWVRETFADLRGMGFDTEFAYRADAIHADGHEDADSKRCRLDFDVNWKPSIHMPRWASRLTDQIGEVRVVRVQDITPEDAIAEGLSVRHHDRFDVDIYGLESWADGWRQSPIDAFHRLWDSIHSNPKRSKRNPYTHAPEDCYVSYPWDDIQETQRYGDLPWYVVGNPFVWVIVSARSWARNVDEVIKMLESK